ncbi:UNVERIFIED_CONTAM: Retrovirus-related Pol polyprotein from transposon RE1 [Sesamum latifolium]|uniref:Retrovirus-related Pol polyprotein from transposon RE1 n=1 Tax=Sesamum latifolium TaxID=2727402 RepID=A0AAW2X4T8_9LAMI
MKKEIHMIEKNNTWVLVDRPKDREVISLKWIFKIKLNQEGKVQKYKARLVARGFLQKSGGEDKVYKLKKALYGLKQAPRAWYKEIDTYFIRSDFERSKSEATLYVKKEGHDILIACLYADDLIFTGNNSVLMQKFKQEMMKTYEMSDLGLLHYFLGIEVIQMEEGIFLSQKKYAKGTFKNFHTTGCKSVDTPMAPNEKLKKDDGAKRVASSTYRSLIGSLLYLTATRPDIMFATSVLSRFMQDPSQFLLIVLKNLLVPWL